MKKFQDSYPCFNRYGMKVSLEKVSPNQYKLKCEDEIIRCIFEEDNTTIKAVDPSGGPFLSVGSFVSTGVMITEIKHSIKHQGFILTLKFKR